MGKAKDGSDRGRPPVIDEDKVRKLETAFSYGASNAEAIAFADVAERTFYDYKKANPKFSQRIDQLREKPILQARKVVVDAMQNGDAKTARWYLERKRKDEFSAKQEVENYGNATKPPIKIQEEPKTLEEAEALYRQMCAEAME